MKEMQNSIRVITDTGFDIVIPKESTFSIADNKFCVEKIFCEY